MALSLSSAAAAALSRRLAPSVARPLIAAGCPSSAAFGHSPDSTSRRGPNAPPRCVGVVAIRPLSSMPPPPTASPPSGAGGFAPGFPPPTSIAPEAGLAAQDAMRLFVEHGLGARKLEAIAASKETNGSSLVDRWQGMVATYLETQCHVIALLGYRPDETGIAAYTQQLTAALGKAGPEVQEKLRASGRDTYRRVLAGAFDMPSLIEEQAGKGELSIVDARNIMHKVSLRMQDPEVLEKVAKKCSVYVAMSDSQEAKQIELASKHTVVQEVMVNDVYLAEDDNGVSMVQDCGFGEGEEGYVKMQSAMAEHQGDPLINQYVGASMMKLLQSAGIDFEALQRGQAA